MTENQRNWYAQVALFHAMSSFQGDIGNVKKNQTNPHFRSQYADLGAVLEVARPVLAEYGLSVLQFPLGITPEGLVGIETLLAHEGGGTLGGQCWAKPKDQGPQQVGSTITYLRRYALAALLGLAQADDDGQSGSTPVTPKAPLKRPKVTKEPQVDSRRRAALKEFGALWIKLEPHHREQLADEFGFDHKDKVSGQLEGMEKNKFADLFSGVREIAERLEEEKGGSE